MSYKNTDGLMRHLRNSGIHISGSKQKQQLINTGYFHGYKGYRFFAHAGNRIPFSSYDDVYATISYDTKLKALLYSKIMYIETAVKNISLNCILNEVGTESIQDMLDTIISSYKNAPINALSGTRRTFQERKLKLQASIQYTLSRAYQFGNPKITHFYEHMNYNHVPIWALFEILTMGDFGFLLQCLTLDVRETISREIGINLSSDTNRELVYKYIYALKDLRNAIAHNDVIFDTRFRKTNPTKPMKQCLIFEMGLPYVDFKNIGDYIILVCYYLKMLKVSKTEIKAFVREFEKITVAYKNSVDKQVVAMVVNPYLPSRMNIVKKYI
jgi:abortive infection bacteriophage resistance protein